MTETRMITRRRRRIAIDPDDWHTRRGDPIGRGGGGVYRLTIEDWRKLSEDEKAKLRGPRGPKGDPGPRGPKGDPLKFEDLTKAQRDALKGEKGERGEKGEKGESGGTYEITEETWRKFWEGMSEDERAKFRGEKGERGEKGDPGPQEVSKEDIYNIARISAKDNRIYVPAQPIAIYDVHARNGLSPGSDASHTWKSISPRTPEWTGKIIAGVDAQKAESGEITPFVSVDAEGIKVRRRFYGYIEATVEQYQTGSGKFDGTQLHARLVTTGGRDDPDGHVNVLDEMRNRPGFLVSPLSTSHGWVRLKLTSQFQEFTQRNTPLVNVEAWNESQNNSRCYVEFRVVVLKALAAIA